MKKIKRTRTWTTKAGITKTKTYEYTVSGSGRTTKKGKTTKQSFRRVAKQKNELLIKDGAVLDQSKIDDMTQNLNSSLKRTVENKIKAIIKNNGNLTVEGLDQRINQTTRSKTEQFVKNLGYTEAEFEAEFGLTDTDLQQGTFKHTQDGVEFTSKTGKNFMFIWDYDGGIKII
ncbi:MAG: hypothetical protein IKT93_02365 [Clostridia bacterium]|nr:hypothetical protein [Clostridia bacterium]